MQCTVCLLNFLFLNFWVPFSTCIALLTATLHHRHQCYLTHHTPSPSHPPSLPPSLPPFPLTSLTSLLSWSCKQVSARGHSSPCVLGSCPPVARQQDVINIVYVGPAGCRATDLASHGLVRVRVSDISECVIVRRAVLLPVCVCVTCEVCGVGRVKW